LIINNLPCELPVPVHELKEQKKKISLIVDRSRSRSQYALPRCSDDLALDAARSALAD
jgi:hypothetical protein